MSSWTNNIASSPRQARRARAEAIIAEMPRPNNPNSDRPIPHWLVNEQNKLRDTGASTPARASRTQRPSASAADPAALPDDDFIMVDMLDGAHVPTRAPRSSQQPRMSTNSDSIISLPPVDQSATSDTWHTLRHGEAQSARRGRHRITTSIGSEFSESIQLLSSSPNAQFSHLPPGPPRYHSTTQPNEEAGPSRHHLPISTQPDEALPPAPPTARKPPVANPPLPSSTSSHSITVAELAAMHPPSSLKPSRSQPKLDMPLPASATLISRSKDIGRDRQDSSLPMPPDVKTPLKPSRSQQHGRMGSYNWFDEETDTYAPSVTSYRRYTQDGRQRFRRSRHEFRPNEWGWRKPAEEDAVMPDAAWLYLPLIGAITFSIAFLVNATSDFVANYIFVPLSHIFGRAFGQAEELIALALLRGLSLAASFVIILRLSPHYGAGSGIPEMKCVLGGVLMPQMLNWQTLVGKMTGLVFSLASGISIGRLGPFIHMSCISAALVSRLTMFPSLRANTRFQLQALSAAMAAGVGATFGSPIGGTLLAVEIMSTYYYIHWIPMALYCSIMGYYFLLAVARGPPSYFSAATSVDLQIDSLRHLLSYIVLGSACGAIGAALVHFAKILFKVRRQFFKNAVPWRTAGMLIGFAAFHTLSTSWIGGVLSMGQKQGVDELFLNEKAVATTWLPGALQLFGVEQLNSAMALIVVMVVKFVLTGLSIVMPVPAGVFMPIFEIGALFGRAFGEGWSSISIFDWVDPKATAIVGAAAMTAGSLHTVSVAVVMLELTREAVDVLPLAVGVIISYGVSKHLCSDLFSELIRIRKLPYILGLRERYPWETKQFYEDVSAEEAGSFMKRDFPFVTPTSTRGEIWDMLTKGGKPWITCAFLSDREGRRLWGTVTQQMLWDVLKEDMLDRDEPEYGTFNASESGVLRGLQTVDFLRNFDPNVGDAKVDMGPMQISLRTPFWKIITLFRMLSMTQIFVMQDGMTVGCLSKADVINHSVRLEERSQRKRQRLAAAARAGGGSSRQGGRGINEESQLPAAFTRTRRGNGTHSRHGSLNRLAAGRPK